MKAKTLQIAWHVGLSEKPDPILSVDIHPNSYVLVTGGADSEVKVKKI